MYYVLPPLRILFKLTVRPSLLPNMYIVKRRCTKLHMNTMLIGDIEEEILGSCALESCMVSKRKKEDVKI